MVDTSSDKLVLRDKEWNGVMSFAYVYELVTDGDVMLLTSIPAEEIYGKLCKDADFSYSGSLGSADADALLSSLDGESYIIRAKIKADDAGMFGFELRSGDENCTAVYYDAEHGIFVVDTTNSGDLASDPTYKYTGGVYSRTLAADEDGYITLDIFVDNCVLEVFANDGDAACSVLVFPDKEERGIRLISDGDITIDSMQVYIVE
jgi:sucrose-6-phosphate hydrolase SacC (GH32 family)